MTVVQFVHRARLSYGLWFKMTAAVALLGFFSLFLWSMRSSLFAQTDNFGYVSIKIQNTSEVVTMTKLLPAFDLKADNKWESCLVRTKHNYIPCLDFEIETYRHQQRSCLRVSPTCLVPLPSWGYDPRVPWPESKWKILYKNIEHPELGKFLYNQTWVGWDEPYVLFSKNQSISKGGILHYIESIDEMILDFEWGEKIRVVLDIGCVDSTFPIALLEKDVLTLTLGMTDDMADMAQVALERGLPAVVSPFATMRLPFPSGAFDAIHCGKCRILWNSNDGKLLLEINRILRPGGYFILSMEEEYAKRKEAMSPFFKATSWNFIAHESGGINDLDITIFQRPESNDKYKLRAKKVPPLCTKDETPDAAWYTPIATCLHPVPTPSGQHSTAWPKEWPQRLETLPEWLANRENVVADTTHWKILVEKIYLTRMGVNWTIVHNVMDMSAGYGGFATALTPQKVWVMNVVPVHDPDTLPVIFERGLVGVYHDWCEAFGTYPRSYDLLHADHVFSRLGNRCGKPVSIAVEIDRILRPDGWLIIRDNVAILDPLELILISLHWKIVTRDAENSEDGFICAQKTTWRP